MNTHNESKQLNLERKLTVSKLAKSFLTKVVIPWTVISNVLYGIMICDLKQDGMNNEEINKFMWPHRYEQYIDKPELSVGQHIGKFVIENLVDSLYWGTKPSREIVFYIYDLINKK